MRRLRVVLADDTVLFRQGMGLLLTGAGVDVVGQAADADELLALVAVERPDVAVIDVRMPPSHTDEGLQAANAIRAAHPSTAVIVFSTFVETAHMDRLLAAGGRGVGYLLKDRVLHVDDFVAALHTVADGGSLLDPEVVAELFARRRNSDALGRLTAREREILALMAQGLSNAGITDRLVLSPKTVERHIGSIFSKLDLDHHEDGHRRVLAVLRALAGD